MSTSDRGFASMNEQKQHEIASKGGSSTGRSKSTSAKRSEAGKKGAAAQSTASKAKGGHNSHRSA